MVPGSCDTCAEPAPLYDESSTYCGRHLPAEVFYLTIPRPDCDTCGADAAAEYYSVGSGFSVGVVAPPARGEHGESRPRRAIPRPDAGGRMRSVDATGQQE